MTTNDQLMREHKHHSCNPVAKKGESQLYDKDCVDDMLDEVRTDVEAKVLDARFIKESQLINTDFVRKIRANIASSIFKELNRLKQTTDNPLVWSVDNFEYQSIKSKYLKEE